MNIDPSIALAGLVVGFAVGLTGMGGGALMTPVLVLIYGVPPLAAVSSDLVASLVMKPLGVAMHARRQTVDWPLTAWLVAGSVPAAFAGVIFLRLAGGPHVQRLVTVLLGAVLILAFLALVVRRWIRAGAQAPPRPLSRVQVRPLPTLLIGTVTGFMVGATSVGSGTLGMVLLLFLYPRLRSANLVGTSLAQAIPMVAAAALGHLLFGEFRFQVTASILAGSVPGVFLGAWLSARARGNWLQTVLAAVLLASGMKLIGLPTAVMEVAVVAMLLAAGFVYAHRRLSDKPGVDAGVEVQAGAERVLSAAGRSG